jgi:hypothetical protein
MSDNMKPCPFCGSSAEMEPWHGGGPNKQMISCSSETCEVSPMMTGETPAEAIAVWNMRTDPGCPQSVREQINGGVTQEARGSFQARVQPWMLACFGEEISRDVVERNHRFLEEALELVQSLGCTKSEAHQLVDYTFGRPEGEPTQEVGGVKVTLAALCLANDIDMDAAGETELARIWTKVEKIRAKQAAKPKHSPLPEATAQAERGQLEARVKVLSEALVPFSQEANDWDPEVNGGMMYADFVTIDGENQLTIGHLRKARTAVLGYDPMSPTGAKI